VYTAQVQVLRVSTTKAFRSSRSVTAPLILTSTLDGGEGSTSHSSRFNLPGKKPSIHSVESCVGFRAGQDVLEMVKNTHTHIYIYIYIYIYRYTPHNDVSVNDGPYIRQWSYKIMILTILLQLSTVFITVTCCTGW
jgi:hypothetical protein